MARGVRGAALGQVLVAFELLMAGGRHCDQVRLVDLQRHVVLPYTGQLTGICLPRDRHLVR